MPNWIASGFDAGRIASVWCSLMHDSAMWPIHGRYQCRKCGRQYPVPWAEMKYAEYSREQQASIPSFRPAVLPLLLLAVVARPIHAAGALVENACPPATIALARYIAGQQNVSRWPVETVRIDASLPKVAKKGRLRAVRRLLPTGRPEYQVLEIAGDPTVKQQVIVRYLSADARTAEIAASSVAVTSANYRFSYVGAVSLGDNLAYAFRITPRKKREGLIKGLLWLDGKTGIAVRQSGYLVKSPSIFIKRVSVTRENYLHDGTIEARITYLAVDTRLVGRAELVIVERPSSPIESGSAPLSAAH